MVIISKDNPEGDAMNSDDESYVVPDDFPNPKFLAAVSGMQNKLLLKTWNGKFYSGLTPPERHARWQHCEELAHWLGEKCIKNVHGKYAHLDQAGILAQYHSRMLSTMTELSNDETTWVVRRAAAVISWPIPAGIDAPAEPPSLGNHAP